MKSKVVVCTIILVIIIVCILIGSIMHKNKKYEETFEARESKSPLVEEKEPKHVSKSIFEAQESTNPSVEEKEANPVSESTSEFKESKSPLVEELKAKYMLMSTSEEDLHDNSKTLKEVDKKFMKICSNTSEKDFLESYNKISYNGDYINDIDILLNLNSIYSILSTFNYKELLNLYKMENNRYKYGSFPIIKNTFKVESCHEPPDLTCQVLEEKYWNLLRLNYQLFFISLKETENKFFSVSFLFAKDMYFDPTTTIDEIRKQCLNFLPIFTYFEKKFPVLIKNIFKKKIMIVSCNDRHLRIELWTYGIITWYNLCLRYKKMDIQSR